jgi:hypothetical protein
MCEIRPLSYMYMDPFFVGDKNVCTWGACAKKLFGKVNPYAVI